MFPVLIEIGPFTFYTYGLFVALGLFTGVRIAIFMAAREGFQGKDVEDAFYTLLFYFAVGGLLGGRLLYALIHSREFAGDPLSVLKVWQGGLVSYGGLAGGFAGFLVWQRKHAFAGWKKMADWVSPSIVFGHALGRLGCLFAGCCFGRPTGLPWGLVFTNPRALAPLGIPLHPTQIYEFGFLSLAGIFLLKRYSLLKRSGRPDGTLFADYLTLYSAGRFAIEFFRGDDPRFWGLSPGQIASLAVFAGSFVFRIFFLDKRGPI